MVCYSKHHQDLIEKIDLDYVLTETDSPYLAMTKEERNEPVNVVKAIEKIAEIKNLNLIYIFTTDSILRNKSEKYVGATIVYNKDQKITLDYKSEYFERFIRKVLGRYNKEKNKRNIINSRRLW